MQIDLPDGTSTDAATGAIVTHEPKDMFYGLREGQTVDKYGIRRAFGQKCAIDENAPVDCTRNSVIKDISC